MPFPTEMNQVLSEMPDYRCLEGKQESELEYLAVLEDKKMFKDCWGHAQNTTIY